MIEELLINAVNEKMHLQDVMQTAINDLIHHRDGKEGSKSINDIIGDLEFVLHYVCDHWIDDDTPMTITNPERVELLWREFLVEARKESNRD